ncbi:hypothetical protein AAHE18_19G080300 [Arachis hypogaea]
MYADRVDSGVRRSAKERLNGNTVTDSSRPQRQITGKRQRQDDKWEHDLFDDDDGSRITNRKVTSHDLRLKLQKRKVFNRQLRVEGVLLQMCGDLRERLSGTMTSKVVAKPSSKSVGVEAPAVQAKRPSNSVPKRLPQKADISVDDFLQSLGLEKYLITFQAEELFLQVDMAALNHMTDEDLKAMGIPMGPRKKILLALESKV